MDPVAELRLLCASGTTLVSVETREEARLLELVRAATGGPVWTWSAASGLCRDGAPPVYGTDQADQVVDNLAALGGSWTAVLCDPAPILTDPTCVRELKELTQRSPAGRTVVLVAPHLALPLELDGLAHPFRLPPPTLPELMRLVERVELRVAQRGLASELDDGDRLQLGRSLTGLTLVEAERELMALALADGRLTEDDVAAALADKAELLNTDGVLEVVTDATVRLAGLGGLVHLKAWIDQRVRAGLDRADDPPRGLLLAGVPGCGKSAVARAIAGEWAVPLVLLDPARIYSKYVGESEQRFDTALATVEAMAPAVLWIDEIEKGFASGSEDGGVSTRVLGTFLRWLQDRDAPVFVVATANDVTRLPAELTRKGRFDELFFVDLPEATARVEILRSLLAGRETILAESDLEALADASDGFSGAELEAAVVAASYAGPLTGAGVAAELSATVPLARSRPAEVAQLRAWAASHARAA